MKFLWIDTETTGLDEKIHRPFEVAIIFVNNRKEPDGRITHLECERDFYLNPLRDGIEISQEALNITGYTEEKIRALKPAADVVPIIAEFLKDTITQFGTGPEEKSFLCGYNVGFDYKMIKALFNDFELNFDDYIMNHQMDVFNQVKSAGNLRLIPYLPDRKLTTVAEHFRVNLENAHNALADIRATKEVSKSLHNKGVPLK
ncbi:MAG: 3'-5' exonuclease [Bacilli bacterium]|nr:3'-5' exonuclease [Bacilli bacterium]